MAPRRLSVNPVDAERLQLVSGGLVVVENDRGALVCRVRVTPRIMPGVVALPEGAWHDADMWGDRLDWGGLLRRADGVVARQPPQLVLGPSAPLDRCRAGGSGAA